MFLELRNHETILPSLLELEDPWGGGGQGRNTPPPWEGRASRHQQELIWSGWGHRLVSLFICSVSG